MEIKTGNKHIKNFKYKKMNILIFCVFLLIVIIVALVFKNKYSLNTKEGVVNKLNKIIVLPNEEPIIETINDAEGLKKESPFYANVENDDKILIFPKASRIIIYREKENKIINVGPIIDK